jgi:hypothetical protein
VAFDTSKRATLVISGAGTAVQTSYPPRGGWVVFDGIWRYGIVEDIVWDPHRSLQLGFPRCCTATTTKIFPRIVSAEVGGEVSSCSRQLPTRKFWLGLSYNQPLPGDGVGIGQSFLLTSAKILFLGCRPLDHGWLRIGRLDWAEWRMKGGGRKAAGLLAGVACGKVGGQRQDKRTVRQGTVLRVVLVL